MTKRRNVVLRPLALLTSAIQVPPFGNELLMLARRSPEETRAPPPNGTVPVGQARVPRVCRPAGAASRALCRVTYFRGRPAGSAAGTRAAASIEGPAGWAGCSPVPARAVPLAATARALNESAVRCATRIG